MRRAESREVKSGLTSPRKSSGRTGGRGGQSVSYVLALQGCEHFQFDPQNSDQILGVVVGACGLCAGESGIGTFIDQPAQTPCQSPGQSGMLYRDVDSVSQVVLWPPRSRST